MPLVVRDLLEAGCAAWGIALDERMADALDVHARLLLAWTSAINLTSVREPGRLAVAHLLDSLSAVPLLRRALGAAAAPGGHRQRRAATRACPSRSSCRPRSACSIESVGKKARFLDVAAAAVLRALGPDGPRPGAGGGARRAEALAGAVGRRAAFDVVTVRAVGSLDRLAALGLPLLRPGGLLVAWKSDDGSGALQEEIRAAGATIAALGARAGARRQLAAGGRAASTATAWWWSGRVRRGRPRSGRTRLLG